MMSIQIKHSFMLFCCTLFMSVAFFSCTKYPDPPLVFEEEPDYTPVKDRKVLIIGIDGLVGRELSKYQPTNIAAMLANAKYSYDAYAETNTTDAATWTTILSGLTAAQHGVKNDEFSDEYDENDPHGHNSTSASTGYITMFQRLLETGKRMHTISVTSVDFIDEKLFAYADDRSLVSSDELARDSIVSKLKQPDERLKLAVVNFRGVNDAGVAGGFSMENAAYKAALDKVDAYIHDITEALKARESYAEENWLIIITSNHGGTGTSYGGATALERSVPVIFYNERFEGYKIEAPSLMNSLVVNKSGNDIPVMTDPNAYEVGSSGEFTVLSKVRMVSASGTNSVLYGKTSHAYSATKGWHLMTVGASKQFRYIIGNGSLKYIASSANFEVGKWYSVGLKIYNEEGKRYAVIYQDGVVTSSPVDITGLDMTAGSSHPFFIGPGLAGKNYGVSSAMINHLAIYDKALSDEEIAAYNCKQELSSSDANYGDLIGYWRLDEGAGHTMANSIATDTDTDFSFTSSSLSWNLGNSWSCLSEEEQEEEAKTKYLIRDIDIAPQVYYWLDIETDDSWNLTGSVFLDRYEIEFFE